MTVIRRVNCNLVIFMSKLVTLRELWEPNQNKVILSRRRKVSCQITLKGLPLDGIVGLLSGSEHADPLWAVPDHPGGNDVVVEQVEVLPIGGSAENEGVFLHLGLDSIHLRLHMLRPEQRHREVLPQKVTENESPEVVTQAEPTDDAGVDRLRIMKSEIRTQK